MADQQTFEQAYEAASPKPQTLPVVKPQPFEDAYAAFSKETRVPPQVPQTADKSPAEGFAGQDDRGPQTPTAADNGPSWFSRLFGGNNETPKPVTRTIPPSRIGTQGGYPRVPEGTPFWKPGQSVSSLIPTPQEVEQKTSGFAKGFTEEATRPRAIAPLPAPAPAVIPKPPQDNSAWDTIKQAFTSHAIKSIGGSTATEAWEKAGRSAKDLIESALGEPWDVTRNNLPAPAKTAEFVFHLSKVVPGILDFLFTPVGAATAAAEPLAAGIPAARAAIGAGFSTSMSKDTAEAYRRFKADPSPSTGGDLAGSLAMTVLPFLHAGGQEYANQVRKKYMEQQAKQQAPETKPAKPAKPAAPRINREQRRASVAPPEEGTPFGVTAGIEKRDRLARALNGGRPYASLSNKDRIAIDDLIAEGYSGAESFEQAYAKSKEKADVQPTKKANAQSQRREANAEKVSRVARVNPQSRPPAGAQPGGKPAAVESRAAAEHAPAQKPVKANADATDQGNRLEAQPVPAGKGPGGQEPGVPAGHGSASVRGLPGTERSGPGAGQPGGGGDQGAHTSRRVTGSADIPLTAKGREQAQDLKRRAPGAQVFTAPNDRSLETGLTVNPQAKGAAWLEPWKLGAHEGKDLAAERKAINERIMNRPDESPGVSPHSGEQGESFNQFRARILKGVTAQRAGMKPGDTVLNITSGRALQVIDARGNREKIVSEKGEFSKPGQLFLREPDGLKPVEKIEGPGQYFAQHGETGWNGSAPQEKSVVTAAPVAAAPVAGKPESIPGRAKVLPAGDAGAAPAAATPESPKTTVKPTPGAPPANPLVSAKGVASPQNETQLKRGEPGWMGNVPTNEVHRDPVRFQYKRNVGQGGVSQKLKTVKRWNPELAGTTAIWRDPANGRDYAVNGHHRHELAERLGVPQIPVKYLEAKDAREARLKGALLNIAEDQGESTDAALVFRDSGMTPEEIEESGVTLGGRIAKEGWAISRLADSLFHDVMDGSLTPARGAVIGEGVPNHADQEALYRLMQERERGGKRLTNDQVEELIRLNSRTSTITERSDAGGQGGLFGVEEMTRSLLPEKAIVSDYVRGELRAEKRLFGTVSKQAAAQRLEAAGNVMQAGQNAEVAEAANQGIVLYDKLSSSAGPIDGILDRAAQQLANGENANAAKQQAYRGVRDYLTEQIERLTGKTDAGQPQRVGAAGPREAGAREQHQPEVAPKPAVKTSQAPPAPQRTAAERAPAPPAPLSPADVENAYVSKMAASHADQGSWERDAASRYGKMLGALASRITKWTPSKSVSGTVVRKLSELVDLGAVRRAWDKNGDTHYGPAGGDLPRGLSFHPEKDFAWPEGQGARDLTKPVPPNATTEQTYKLADWEAKPAQGARRPNRLQVNDAGMKALGHAIGTRFEGLAMNAKSVARLADRLFDYATDAMQHGLISIDAARHLADLSDAIRKASNGGPLVLYKSDGTIALGRRAANLREELTHWKQQGVGDLGIHSNTAKELLAHRNYPLARRALLRQGYSDDPVQMASEIGAKLAAGKFAELGLNRQQALDFLEHYASTLTLRHGADGARDILRFVDARNRIRVDQSIARAALLPPRRPGGSFGTPAVGSLDARGNGSVGEGIFAPAPGRTAGGKEVSNASRASRPQGPGLFDEGTGGEPVRGVAPGRTEEVGGGVRQDVPGLLDADTQRQGREDAQRNKDQLLHDQLTAQLKSGGPARPAKVKPAENRGLFEEEKPETGSLFANEHGGILGPESGAIRASILTAPTAAVARQMAGGGKELAKMAGPPLKDVARALVGAMRDIRRITIPAAFDRNAGRFAAQLRENEAEAARKWDQANHALRDARKWFGKMDAQRNYDFIDRLEHGQKQTNPGLDQIAAIFRTLLDERKREVQALGTGKLRSFYQDYFPHVWKDPKKAGETFRAIFARNPWEGSKSFLKKRTIIYTKDGLAKGLEPVSDNPVDLALAKVREMDRYIAAHKALKWAKENKLAIFVDAREGFKPAGWSQIKDPIGTVYGPSIQQISEYPNAGTWEGLQKVANALGIKQERGFLKLGQAIGRASTGGVVKTLHGTAEDVLAHEIGHQIDFRAGSGEHFVKEWPDAATSKRIKDAYATLRDKASSPAARKAANKTLRDLKDTIAQRTVVNKELRKLADLRAGRKEYTHKREEKMAQLAEMWVGSRELFEKTAPFVFKEWKKFLDANPKLHALRDIQGDTEVTQLTQPYDVGGLVIKGHYWMPEGATLVLDNSLSRGLASKSGLYRGALGMNNILNQFDLGFSAFHAGQSAVTSMGLRASLGYEQLLRGKPLSGIKNLLTFPAAPVFDLVHGDKAIREWLNDGAGGGQMGELVKAGVQAGMRAKNPREYQTGMKQRWADAVLTTARLWSKGEVGAGLVHAGKAAIYTLPAAADASVWLILDWAVPRIKWGSFMDKARFDLDRLGPNADPELVRKTLQARADQNDNLLGELVLDNLRWNRVAKDLAHLSIRSVGWVLGDARAVGGAAADLYRVPKQAIDVARGKAAYSAIDLEKLSNVLGLVTATAFLAVIYQRTHAGIWPAEPKDYFFPRNGEFDEQGRPMRSSIYGYAKDMFDFTEHPGSTLTGKTAPLVNLLSEMIHNKDFYGTEIRNADDPIIKQALDELRHIPEAAEPLAVKNLRKEKEESGGISLQAAENFIGVTPAPKAATESKAERLANDIMNERPRGTRTHADAERRDAEHRISHLARMGKPKSAEITKDLAAGVVTGKMVHQAIADSRLNPLVREFKYLELRDALKVWAVATPAERVKLRAELARKGKTLATKTPAERAVLLPRFREALRQ